MIDRRCSGIFGGAVIALALSGTAAVAADCDETTVGFKPLNDLGAGLYLDQFQGGLYPGGLNAPPSEHRAAGRARADAVEPLDGQGKPDPDGAYVLLSIGMSNTTQEFCSHEGREPCDAWTFMGQATDDPRVEQESLVIANGARGGQAASAWESPGHPNYDRVRDQVLARKGLTEAQVQVVWVKVANPGPTVGLPSPDSDAHELVRRTGNIVRAVRVRYPNVKQVFLSSRIYAGYASTGLNPEPYAYESAFAMKWLIEAQIEQMAGGGVDPVAGDLDFESVAPWLAWGAYLWADGLVPRSDGLIWECADFQNDGTHPARSGEAKVGTLLLRFFLNSPFTRTWFAADDDPCGRADVDDDGAVGFSDLLAVLAAWGPCDGCPEDVNGNGRVDLPDVLLILSNWGPCT